MNKKPSEIILTLVSVIIASGFGFLLYRTPFLSLGTIRSVGDSGTNTVKSGVQFAYKTLVENLTYGWQLLSDNWVFIALASGLFIYIIWRIHTNMKMVRRP